MKKELKVTIRIDYNDGKKLSTKAAYVDFSKQLNRPEGLSEEEANEKLGYLRFVIFHNLRKMLILRGTWTKLQTVSKKTLELKRLIKDIEDRPTKRMYKRELELLIG